MTRHRANRGGVTTDDRGENSRNNHFSVSSETGCPKQRMRHASRETSLLQWGEFWVKLFAFLFVGHRPNMRPDQKWIALSNQESCKSRGSSSRSTCERMAAENSSGSLRIARAIAM